MHVKSDTQVLASRVIPVEPFDLVIFGGTGDLAQRKILPALYRRFRAGQIPQGARVIGAARAVLDRDGWRQFVSGALDEYLGQDEGQRALSPDR